MRKLRLGCLFFMIFSEHLMAEVTEARCKTAESIMDYSTLGDCYDQGVIYPKDKEQAKLNYIYGAMQDTRQGEYGRLKAARALLFQSENELENAMGLYILKSFSDNKNAIVVEKPRYEGDYTYRGAARYYLSIYLLQQNENERALTYLDLALEDGYFWAAYAKLYLKSQLISDDEKSKLISQAENLRKIYFPWYPKGYSCWLQWQIKPTKEDELKFPVDAQKASKLIEEQGGCRSK
ncbi:hypothetical protein [Pseudomonas sp. RIT-PI-AD]|uniref:hypothetical protein n=1 Tax=Pseudomonas sp. RIT-PI-AD TaxID=3035294 RepID=UPI0021DA72C9|nr:hypothetical protein [Pseudomonas sp. RIT-PI-AD]